MSSHVTPHVPERAGKRSVSLPQSLIKEVEERTGKTGFSSVVSEALEQWLARAKLREVVEADRKHAPVSDEARAWAEDAWSASA
ncbi:hypothetical protein [Streptomyces himalayensis]|uniref:Ribbon-helix-helix protein, CopG family n=1 Tax=Streptomyces himalayensis subsp. himalayensis TaxID=2756131 RepID=A0A7W0IAI9_9ACTN|nr:hypothetical protein [Streptomyces himalayensis]MBA2948363.1 hypothetical protein [Streptomyces himalayensis subsp. himalayensis]